MSTLLPSSSLRPLLSSGIAPTPPVPVEVATPADSRRNHSSSVKVGVPRPSARPKVTYWLVPLKRSAVFVSASANRGAVANALPTSATTIASVARESAIRARRAGLKRLGYVCGGGAPTTPSLSPARRRRRTSAGGRQ